LVFLIVLVLVSLLAFYLADVDFVTAFLMASGAAVLTYVIGSIAGIRLLNERGIRRVLPWISLLVSLALLPFIGALLAASVAIAGIGLLASWVLSRRERGAIPGARGRGLHWPRKAGKESRTNWAASRRSSPHVSGRHRSLC